jgi:hypothetical protein
MTPAEAFWLGVFAMWCSNWLVWMERKYKSNCTVERKA